MSSKGNLFDSINIGVILFASALIIVIGSMVYGAVVPQLKIALPSTYSQDILTNGEEIFPAFDYVYLGLMVGMLIYVVISASMIRSHPMFFVLSLIVVVLSTMVMAPLSNAYEKITNDTTMSSAASSFVIINWTMDYLPVIIIIVGIVVAIAMYSKNPESAGGAGIAY